MITISLFPSIITKKQYPNVSVSWNQTYFTGNFEICQLLGSLLAKRFIGRTSVCIFVAILRTAFLGLFLGIESASDDAFLSQYWVAHILTSLLALSAGYLTNSFIIQASNQYESQIHKKLCNYISLFFFFFGSFAGTIFGIIYLNKI